MNLFSEYSKLKHATANDHVSQQTLIMPITLPANVKR